MYDIILIEPIGGMNFTAEITKRGNSTSPYAIECLAGYLMERGGFKVGLIHQRPITINGRTAIIADEDIVEIIALNPNCFLVGISAITSLYPHALSLAKMIKEKISRIKIVVGGYHPSSIKERAYVSKTYCELEAELQSKLVDYFVIGEGEKTILEIANKERNKNDKRNHNKRK